MTMTAEILTIQDDGSTRVACTWSLADGRAVCSDDWDQEMYDRVGIVRPGQGLVYPKDGAAFIETLPSAFSGSRMRARVLP